MSMITITPIIVPPRSPVLQPQAAVADPSWKTVNNKRSREDDDASFCDSKRPRSCPPLADALAFFTTGAWQTEEEYLSGSSSSTYTAGLSEDEDSPEENGESIEENTPDGASDSSSSLPTWPAGVSWEDSLKFSSQDDLLAWVNTLPQILDEQDEEDSSPSYTSDVPSEPTLPLPSPIFAVEQEQPLHYVPAPKEYKCARRAHRSVDTEDLRLDVANNLRWQRYFASQPSVFPPAYERDLLPPETFGTPPRSIDERTKLEPPTSAYKYTLGSPSLSPSSAALAQDDGANSYSASELFGPDASTVKVARCAPIRPRARTDFCELTTLEHTLALRCPADEIEHGDAPTDPSESATATAYADPCAVEFWKASVNGVVEQVRAKQLEEATARLEAEVKAFFEEAAADDDDDFEAVEIPDESEVEAEAEVDVSFVGGYASAVSESSRSELEGEGAFDYDGWVADCEAL